MSKNTKVMIITIDGVQEGSDMCASAIQGIIEGAIVSDATIKVAEPTDQVKRYVEHGEEVVRLLTCIKNDWTSFSDSWSRAQLSDLLDKLKGGVPNRPKRCA